MITVTDLFSGAGGSSTGMMQVAGVHVRIAANHFQIVTDIHALNHPNTDHAVVDLHLEQPSFFPKTDILWASPECTKWSQANGAKLPAIDEGLFEDPLSDDAKTRSRLLMFDVLKFIDYHRYRLVIVENVVDIATQARYRTAWTIWRQELRALGYEFRVVSLNSMHAQLLGNPAPQSRDRIYVVAWPIGEAAPDLDRVVRPRAHCDRCDVMVDAVQSFKPNRTVGRYRQAYVYCCPKCGAIVEPGWLPAAAAIDWSIPGERVGERLKPKTRARIAAGIARYWGPLHVEAAGNTYDAADPNHLHHGEPDAYYRAWPTDEPLRALHTTNSKALAVPVEGRDGKATQTVDAPFRTLTTRAETAFVTQFRDRVRDLDPRAEPLRTIVADGANHALVEQPFVMTNQHNNRARSTDEPLPTATTTTGGGSGLVDHPFVAEMYGTSTARPVSEPAGTFTAGGNHHALVTRHYGSEGGNPARHTTSSEEYLRTMTGTGGNMSLIHRMNTGGAEMTTPASEELRTLTTAGHQAVLRAPARRAVTVADLKAAEEMVPEVLFRMFQPHEVAAGMAFPKDYKWQPPDRNKPISNRDLVKAAGNAVTPPSARDLMGVCLESLGYEMEVAA